MLSFQVREAWTGAKPRLAKVCHLHLVLAWELNWADVSISEIKITAPLTHCLLSHSPFPQQLAFSVKPEASQCLGKRKHASGHPQLHKASVLHQLTCSIRPKTGMLKYITKYEFPYYLMLHKELCILSSFTTTETENPQKLQLLKHGQLIPIQGYYRNQRSFSSASITLQSFYRGAFCVTQELGSFSLHSIQLLWKCFQGDNTPLT